VAVPIINGVSSGASDRHSALLVAVAVPIINGVSSGASDRHSAGVVLLVSLMQVR